MYNDLPIFGICSANKNITPNELFSRVRKAPVIPSAIGYDTSQDSS